MNFDLKTNNYNLSVQYLESLSLMPKTMPGLEKLRQALKQTTWFSNVNPEKVIVVAGTNGKGSTCAALETLLLDAKQKVGLFTSPHLVSTTERIRINGHDISQNDFVDLFNNCKPLIDRFELTHFESLALMAGEYFFKLNTLDYVIFEVGLGGLFDATNAYPHKYSVITSLGLDHQNILGSSLVEIAANKFGIIQNQSIVIHHQLPAEVLTLFFDKLKQTDSKNYLAEIGQLQVKSGYNPIWKIDSIYGRFLTNLPGSRAVENIMTALKVFEVLGFNPSQFLTSLAEINWRGRMQKVKWPTQICDVYLSGDHNQQGIDSLIELLQFYDWKTLHIVVGIGFEKDFSPMLEKLTALPRVKIYLSETPFKGLKINQYPENILKRAEQAHPEVSYLLDQIKADEKDLILVTGSLYLVGKVLSQLKF